MGLPVISVLGASRACWPVQLNQYVLGSVGELVLKTRQRVMKEDIRQTASLWMYLKICVDPTHMRTHSKTVMR